MYIYLLCWSPMYTIWVFRLLVQTLHVRAHVCIEENMRKCVEVSQILVQAEADQSIYPLDQSTNISVSRLTFTPSRLTYLPGEWLTLCLFPVITCQSTCPLQQSTNSLSSRLLTLPQSTNSWTWACATFCISVGRLGLPVQSTQPQYSRLGLPLQSTNSSSSRLIITPQSTSVYLIVMYSYLMDCGLHP